VPELHEFKDPAVAENHSSTSQLAKHSFLGCVIILTMLASYTIFQDPEQVVF
jgi:hypothetical protein